MALKPERTIQKILISTTSRLVGEYEREKLLVTHAWPDLYDPANRARLSEGPTSRSAYILAFETKPMPPSGAVPDYSRFGTTICSYLSVLFGKRFDSHGPVEGTGIFYVPDLSEFGRTCDHSLPHNLHQQGIDCPVPLHLVEVGRMEPILLSQTIDLKLRETFEAAAKFYLQGLQNIERDAEVAYLHLITSGEILSNYHQFDQDDLLDDEIKDALNEVEDRLDDGGKVVRLLKSRMLQIKRRFIRTICSLVDSDFFQRSESRNPVGAFKPDSFERSVSAAYDLRSKYVHTGKPFGLWVALSAGGLNNEVQLGKPVMPDNDLSKLVLLAPTFVGFERTIRYCLFRFAELNGLFIDPDSEPS